MALTVIKGYNVALYVNDKYVGCADTIGLSIKIAEDSTACRADAEDVEDGLVVNSSEPGAADITGQLSGIVRQATLTDAATNVTAENMVDMALAGTTFTYRYSLGKAVGSARYGGMAYFTSVDLNAGQTDNGKFSASFRGKDKPTKTTVPTV